MGAPSLTLQHDSDKAAGGDQTRSGYALLTLAWYAFLALAIIAGLGAIFVRTRDGLAVTNLSSVTPWGAWVAFYIYFVGLSAGAFLLSSLIFVFGMERYERLGRSALLTAILSMVVALIFVLLDLGRMERNLNALIFFNPYSVLAWEIRFYVVYIALLLAELWFSMRLDLVRESQGQGLPARVARLLTFGRVDTTPEAERRDRAWLRLLGTIGVPIAIFGVHGGTGSIFAVTGAREFWHSPLFPVIFVVSALVSGTALLTLIYILGSRLRRRPVDAAMVEGLGQLAGMFLLVDLGLEFYEFLVGAYDWSGAAREHLLSLFTGRLAWSFWGVQLFLGSLVPAVLLVHPRSRHSVRAIAWASALIVVGVLAFRFNIVIPPLLVPVLEGLPRGDYAPTAVEWVSSLGVIALGMLLYTTIASILPIDQQEHGGEAR